MDLVRIEPTKASFAPGEQVFVTISNLDSIAYFYSTCKVTLERLAGSSWTRVTTMPACGDVGSLIGSGVSLTLPVLINTPEFKLPLSLESGVYRCVIGLSPRTATSPSVASSAPFRVAPAR